MNVSLSRSAALVLGVALAIVVATIVALAAHGRGAEARPPITSDSALVTTAHGRLPLDEALARFRIGLPEVTRLEHGARDRDELIRRFMAAVARQDTAAVRTLVLSRAEFAYLYFPQSAYAKQPHRQDPALTWFLSLQDSQKGITRVFNRFAGQPAKLLDYTCSNDRRAEGALRVWQPCRITVREARGELASLRLFGPILEHRGRYKFLTFANDL